MRVLSLLLLLLISATLISAQYSAEANQGNGNGKGNSTKPIDNKPTKTNNGTQILTAQFSITYPRNNPSAKGQIGKEMRSIANLARIPPNNFIFNNGDIIQNATVAGRWSIKVGFKAKNETQRQLDLDNFTTQLLRAGLGGIRTADATGGASTSFFIDAFESQVVARLETMAVQSCADGTDIPAESDCPENIAAYIYTSAAATLSSSIILMVTVTL